MGGRGYGSPRQQADRCAAYACAVTHEYTVLTGGLILPGADLHETTAMAWAGDTILAIGEDAEVRAISRGDSHFVDLRGATVIPLAAGSEPVWPTDATLEVGGPADLAVLTHDPRLAPLQVQAVVRSGRLVDGVLTPAIRPR